MSVGIDHIATYVPGQYLALTDLAEARNVDPNKYLVGLGVAEMAVPLASEDVVVLAANAGHRVLKKAGVSPKDIGLLIVGTESAEDNAKPTATHIHALLGISEACRVYDITHGCALTRNLGVGPTSRPFQMMRSLHTYAELDDRNGSLRAERARARRRAGSPLAVDA